VGCKDILPGSEAVKKETMVKAVLGILSVVMGSMCWGTTTPAVTFRGQATAVNATVLGINTVIGDTGPLPTKGGAFEADLVTVNIPLVLSGVIAHSDVIGVGDHTEASSTVTGLNVLCNGLLIRADLIQSRAYVSGFGGQTPVSTGSSQLVNLVVAGKAIVVTGAPNQTIKLPNGKIVINERSQGTGAITVSALHIVINGVADIKLARSFAGVGPCSGCTNTCSGTPNCSGNVDFLTGSGALLSSLNGLAHFGLGLGLNNGSNWGGFVFDDPDSLMTFRATSVTEYLVSSETERHIEGVGKVNGLWNVNYVLDVVESGTQGAIVTLNLSNGYKISGPLQMGFLQIRQGCNN
jgi:hypothetical protein